MWSHLAEGSGEGIQDTRLADGRDRGTPVKGLFSCCGSSSNPLKVNFSCSVRHCSGA